MRRKTPKILEPHNRRRRWGALVQNILLLPPALIYVVVERVFWNGAKRLLRQTARIPAIATVQQKLEMLPPWAVLPLFLVPEIFSHIGGFWASALLVQRKWAAAMLVGLFIKGTATLMEVWIYQSCEKALLSVRWFAWLHGWAMRGRDWVYDKMRPAIRLIRGSRSSLGRRFAALRGVIARRLGFGGK